MTHSRPSPERLAFYGLTADAYDAMLEAQGGCCGICRSQDAAFVIDHDHDTGQVRGLLCGACNTRLGRLGDRPVWITAAAVYLTQALARAAIVRTSDHGLSDVTRGPGPRRAFLADGRRRARNRRAFGPADPRPLYEWTGAEWRRRLLRHRRISA